MSLLTGQADPYGKDVHDPLRLQGVTRFSEECSEVLK
jgi:hypothetical protein